MPTPESMLAMKLPAHRLEDDFAQIETDRADIHGLMRITGSSDYEGLVALMLRCYPRIPDLTEPGVSPRLEAKPRPILDEHEADIGDVVPTWRAGRGPPTRDC